MSAQDNDTDLEFFQFVAANDASYVTPDGRLVIDDPEIRRQLVKAIDSYTAIYRKGCTPPDSVTWNGYGNNEKFLAQAVVMTANVSLSIPNELKRERPEDYYKNTATIEWPLGPHGEPFPIVGTVVSAMVFKGGSNAALAKEFVRFLVAEGWLAHYLDFSGGTLPAGDVEAARAAVLARPGRPAPDGIGDADELAPAGARVRLRRDLGQLAAPAGQPGARLGEGDPPRRRPKASAPSRRSTTRSPASSRFWRSEGYGSGWSRLYSPRYWLLAPPAARAADLVVWWDKGFYPQEDAAVREIIAAFEQETGKQVELVF